MTLTAAAAPAAIPDEVPTNVVLRYGVGQLGAQIFRDTPAVLKQFTAAFHPRLVGLTGSAEAIAKTAKEYGIYYARGAGTADGYMMDHSRQIYLFDPDGKPLALLPEGPPQAIADEVTKWAR
ncbi:SCO family protein [Sphingomonas adhaesiva]|uniref:SCO family protein n=1 Tax=Sphingomonas adhaesiva TaxID=28212 RepID=UPI0035C7828D